MIETELILKPIGFNRWEVVEDFVKVIETKEMLTTIVVKRGFETDLASVPRIFWVMFPPFSCPQPAVIHDWIWEKTDMPSKQRDEIFYNLMIDYGMYKWKAKIMWGAVKIYSKLSDMGFKLW